MYSMNMPRSCLTFTNLCFFSFAFICCLACVWCAINAQMFRDINYSLTKSHYIPSLVDLVGMRLWSAPLTTIFIAVAAVTMFTSCCGMLGAGCKVKCAIRTYILLVTMVTAISFWLFFITGVYGIYSGNPNTRAYLARTLRTHYGEKRDVVTHFWDYVMVNYECCGSSGYFDFNDTKWRQDHPDELFPVHCCTVVNKTIPLDPECTKKAVAGPGNHIARGCFDALRSDIQKNKQTFIFYATVLSLSYFLIVSFSLCLIRGEPLLDAEWKPIKVQPSKAKPPPPTPKPSKEAKVTVSKRSLEDCSVFADEPPRKVVRVISTFNPGQIYKFDPSVFKGNETWPCAVDK